MRAVLTRKLSSTSLSFNGNNTQIHLVAFLLRAQWQYQEVIQRCSFPTVYRPLSGNLVKSFFGRLFLSRRLAVSVQSQRCCQTRTSTSGTHCGCCLTMWASITGWGGNTKLFVVDAIRFTSARTRMFMAAIPEQSLPHFIKKANVHLNFPKYYLVLPRDHTRS